MSNESSPLLRLGTAVVNPSKRIGVALAAVFVVGTICGSGVLAIPKAIVDAGYAGIPLLVACGCVSAYTGTLLGKCWTVLQSRYPEYSLRRVPDPYPTIGLRAAGKVGEYATRVCIDVTLFGGAVVFILLISDNITNLMFAIGNENFYSCYMLLIVWCFLTPLSWLGTPKDFWQAGVLAAATTSVGALLIMAGALQDEAKRKGTYEPPVTALSFFSAFGTILYSFGGASCFPTIQVDMANPKKFPRAAVIGLLAVLCLYLPAGISCFIIFGDDMKPNVLDTLSPGGISYTINILITAHLLMAFIIITNPVTQEIEGFLKIRDKFSWKRVMVRTIYTLAILFVALSIPHFNVILALVGGSTIAATSFIFPPLFYYLLSRQRRPEDGRGPPPELFAEDETDEHEGRRNGYILESEPRLDWLQVHLNGCTTATLFLIIFIGVVGGLSSTFFAISSLVTGESGFTVPCYVNVTV